MKTRIGVVVACFNRKAGTLACLRAVAEQELPANVEVQVFLLDDASTDGTARAVAEQHPGVIVLHGDGQHFWNGGMRVAFAAALERDFDFYLWLNDDTTLWPRAVDGLLAAHASVTATDERPTIVVGATADPVTEELTYGGVARPNPRRPLRFVPVPPAAQARPVSTMNGNCVLVPRDVAERVGNLDPQFTHAMGDYDYGLRARAAGCRVVLAPAIVGTCAANPLTLPSKGGIGGRLRQLGGTKQLPPRDWALFARRWAGPLWPVYWVSPYVRRARWVIRPEGRTPRRSSS